MAVESWIILVHHLPARPVYLRAKVGKLLARAGGVALKNSVYVFPPLPDVRRALDELMVSAGQQGGEFLLLDAQFLAGLDDEHVRQRFRDVVDGYCGPLLSRAAALARAPEAGSDGWRAQVEDIRKSWRERAAQDHFGSTLRAELDARLTRLERQAGPRLRGRVWVTGVDLELDRAASAWVLRRVVDPDGCIRFDETAPDADVERFGVPGAAWQATSESTCAEVLVRAFSVSIPSVLAVVESVHDAVFDDARFGRPESLRLLLFLDSLLGMRLGSPEARLARAFVFFDELKEGFDAAG